MNPGKFWEDFDSDNIVFSEGDFQGRYGYKIIHFKKGKGVYKTSEIISYAKKNDWNIFSTKKYVSQDIISWKENNELLFKPSITGFNPNEIEGGFVKVFPRYIDSGFTVYEFSTNGMILVNSETNDSTQRVGFVLQSEDKSMITAYHLWGETAQHEIDDGDI